MSCDIWCRILEGFVALIFLLAFWWLGGGIVSASLLPLPSQEAPLMVLRRVHCWSCIQAQGQGA